MAADKIHENGNGNKNQNKTLEAVFKEAHDYLENLEKNIAKLLKKFHLNNGSFDGDIDKKTTGNHIEEVYQEKILKLKEDLLSNKKTLNKQALVSSLISMSMQAQGQALGEVSQLARKELKGKDLAEFEKDKNEFLKNNNTNEFQELRKDLVETSNKLGNYGEFIVESKEMSERDYLKQKSISLLEKRLKKQIGQREFEAGMNQVMQESGRLSIEHEVIKTFANKIKEIDYSQAKKAGERSMTSGVLPIGLIMTPGLRNLVPALPLVIGAGIWYRLTQGTAKDKINASLETIAYIAPISGTYYSGKDTYIAWENYKKGKCEMGDVVANGAGTVISAGFDVATIFLALTGVGAPAAIGSNALKISAKEAVILGIKKISSIVTREAVEKGTTDGFLVTLKEFGKGKIKFLTSAHAELGTVGIVKKGTQQIFKETGEGVWSIITFKPLREMDNIASKVLNSPFKAADKLIATPKLKIVEKLESKGIMKSGSTERLKQNQSAIALREINRESRSDLENQTMESESKIHPYMENLSSKNLDSIIRDTKDIIKNKSAEDLKDIMEAVKAQDEHMGNSMNVMLKLLNSVEEYDKIRNASKGANDINAMKNIASIEEIIKSYEGKISKGLYEYLERTIKRMKDGEDFSPSSANYMLVKNKLSGVTINGTFTNSKQIQDYQELIHNGEKESINGYAGNYFKLLEEMNNIDFRKLKGEKADIFIEHYLEMLKNSEHSGNGVVRVETMETMKKGENIFLGTQTGYEQTIEKLLSNSKTQDIRDIIVKHTDLSLITRQDLKEKIVTAGLDSLKNMELKDRITQLKHLSFYDDYKGILIEKINPTGEAATKYYGIIKDCVKETNSNRDLLVLLDFARDNKSFGLISQKRGISDKSYIENRILENISKNTQINDKIGTKDLSSDGKMPITREELDNLFRDVSKLGDDKFRQIVEIVATKINKNDKFGDGTTKTMNDKIAESIIPRIESHDVAAKFCKEFKGIQAKIERKNDSGILEIKEVIIDKEITDYIVKDVHNKNRYSIEYRIKFLKELENNGIDTKEFKEELALILANTEKTSNFAFINKLDEIEHFFGNNPKLKERIVSLKQHDNYKDISEKVDEKIAMILDTDRSFSDRFIKDLKNSGEVTHYTLSKINTSLKDGDIKKSTGEVIKQLDEFDIIRLEKLKKQVEAALSNYEFNLFDASEFSKIKETEQVDYLFGVIDQMSGWQLSHGTDSAKELNRTIVKQLNVLKNNFNISPELIDKFLYKILENKNLKGFNIESKVNLLKLLERTNVIKPSVEHKLEYVIAIDAKSSELRADISHIKSYAKNFEEGLSTSNLKIKEMKENKDEKGIEDYVRKTITERVPIEEHYLDGKNLRAGIDYVTIDGKIYITEVFPSRYFISKMLETTDLRQKESYMELIHNKKEFGDRNIKDYFKDENTDIHSKILLSYHDELKYDPEVISFLQTAVKTNPKEVAYAMEKRRDFDIISGKGGNINEALLDKMLTHEYVEEKLAKKITKEEFEKYKDGIKKMLLFIDNKEFQSIVTNVRAIDDFDDNKIQEIVKELKSAGIAIDETLLTSKEFLILALGVRSADGNKKHGIIEDTIKQRKGIESILEDKNLNTIITSARASRDEEKHNRERGDADKMLENSLLGKGNTIGHLGTQSRGGKDIFDESSKFPTEVENIIKSASPEQLKAAELEGNLIKTNSSETETNIGGKNIKIKTILGLLVTFGIMTRAEANDTAQDIELSWLNSPEYKKFNELGGEKSQQALEIRENTVKKLAGEKLKPFIDGFDERIRDRNREKINSYPATIQVILSEAFEKGFPLIKDKSQRNLNIFNSGLITYIDQLNNISGKSEQAAQNLFKRFPEFEGSNFQKILLDTGKSFDNMGVNIDKIEKRNEIIIKLKNL